MHWATPSPTCWERRIRHLSHPTMRTCRCSSLADRQNISVRRGLTFVPSSPERRSGPRRSAPGAVALANQLGELSLEAGDSPFELVHAVAERRNLALDELPRAVTHPLIHLGRGLLDRLTRKSIVEHGPSYRTGRKGTRSNHG